VHSGQVVIEKLITYGMIAVGSAFLAAGALRLAREELERESLGMADDTWTEVTADAG
jgi:hypothetical protein